MDTRGVADHEVIESIYFRDPNGYVIELTSKVEGYEGKMASAREKARAQLDAWQAEK